MSNPNHDDKGRFASLGGSNPRRWGRMNSTEKARLTTSAQFSTKTKSGKAGKLPTLGRTEPRMQPPKPFQKSEPNAHAVAIQTAKALDRDFHHARNKAAADGTKAVIANYKGPVTKLPPGPKPKYGLKGRMK